MPQKVAHHPPYGCYYPETTTVIGTTTSAPARRTIIMNGSNKDDEADAEGQDLAAAFFKKAQSMGIEGGAIKQCKCACRIR